MTTRDVLELALNALLELEKGASGKEMAPALLTEFSDALSKGSPGNGVAQSAARLADPILCLAYAKSAMTTRAEQAASMDEWYDKYKEFSDSLRRVSGGGDLNLIAGLRDKCAAFHEQLLAERFAMRNRYAVKRA